MLLLSLGYLLIQPRPRPEWADPALQPETLLSLSEEICLRFPQPQLLDWVSGLPLARDAYLAALHAPLAERAAMAAWAGKGFEKTFGWPGVFYKKAEAAAARDQFHLGGLELVGVGLPHQHIAAFLAAAEPGSPATGESGYLAAARQAAPPAPNGRFLGYELLNVHAGQLNDSWIVNGLDVACAERPGVRTNHDGFISDLADAERCLAHIAAAGGAEPGPWFPFAIVLY